jgi:putative transposase
MIKAYKYRLHPNNEQITFFEKSFGCVRFVYNWALNQRIEAYQKDGTRISWVESCKQLTELKKQEETEWLCEVANQSLQSSIRNMDSAFTRFFREKKGFPKFHSKKHGKLSFQLVQGVSVDFDTHKVKLPKVGEVKFGKNKEFVGKIGTCTVSKTPTGKYYISILVDDGKPTPENAQITADTSVGIDVGIKDFAVLSNGQVYSNPKYLEKNENRLKVLQIRLSRKQKDSKRRERARLAVARQHEKIRNRRVNFIHQVTSRIVRENQTVIIEDLNVDGMLKNHNLAKHIESVSWSEFFRQLQYKCDWQGRNLIRIGRFEPSSKMCLCGYINKDLTLKDREWDCPQCGRHNDRDLLAAVNIKRFGLQKQNLIGEISPVVNGAEDVESPTLVWVVKRQCIIV